MLKMHLKADHHRLQTIISESLGIILVEEPPPNGEVCSMAFITVGVANRSEEHDGDDDVT